MSGILYFFAAFNQYSDASDNATASSTLPSAQPPGPTKKFNRLGEEDGPGNQFGTF